MLVALRLALGPALLLQGRRVRRTILRLPEAAGPRTGQTGKGQPLSLLILGDSSAAGVGATRQDDDALAGRLAQALSQDYCVRWRVLAQTGWTTQDALDALPELDRSRFDAAVLALGVNDITTETGLSAWLASYRTLLERLRMDHGASAFVLSGLPPMGRFSALPNPLRWYMGQQSRAHDRALAALAADTADAQHIRLALDRFAPEDAADDGFHPGPPIYAAWGQIAADAIRAMHAVQK